MQRRVRAQCSAFWDHVIKQQAEAAELQDVRPSLTRNVWQGLEIAIEQGNENEVRVLDMPRFKDMM